MVDYSRFREIEADDDDVAQAKVAKHNESMHVIHELLRRVDPDITDAAAALLVRFISAQHRGTQNNNLRRRAEVAALLSERTELLCKRAVERLLRLGQACVDESTARDFGERVDLKALLRVATEALNTLMFALVEGVSALARMSSAGPDRPLLDRYLRLEYASALIVAGHPDKCAEIPAGVPYGDVRDVKASASADGPAPQLGTCALAAVFALSTAIALGVHAWRSHVI